jgi:hypothetical protein
MLVNQPSDLCRSERLNADETSRSCMALQVTIQIPKRRMVVSLLTSTLRTVSNLPALADEQAQQGPDKKCQW